RGWTQRGGANVKLECAPRLSAESARAGATRGQHQCALSRRDQTLVGQDNNKERRRPSPGGLLEDPVRRDVECAEAIDETVLDVDRSPVEDVYGGGVCRQHACAPDTVSSQVHRAFDKGLCPATAQQEGRSSGDIRGARSG